jgi:hypothetical protein
MVCRPVCKECAEKVKANKRESGGKFAVVVVRLLDGFLRHAFRLRTQAHVRYTKQHRETNLRSVPEENAIDGSKSTPDAPLETGYTHPGFRPSQDFIPRSFGWRLCWPQNYEMNAKENAHVPFAQLSAEKRFFFLLAVKSATLHLRPVLAALQVVIEDVCLSRVWDEYNFTPADAVDFFGAPERLEPYLVHYVVKDPLFWCPRLAARRSPLRNRK